MGVKDIHQDVKVSDLGSQDQVPQQPSQVYRKANRQAGSQSV
jgi:hypothetical protein